MAELIISYTCILSNTYVIAYARNPGQTRLKFANIRAPKNTGESKSAIDRKVNAMRVKEP